MRLYLGLLLLVIFTLSACTFGVPIGDRGQGQDSTTPKTTKSKRGNPSSYVVFGKRYYVLDSSDGFVQRGIASWYGTKFHGRLTSSGEVYNMHAMTAAHKTLPIPVYVHVKNLDNGRSMVVRVNDRGPFVTGRIIDLSYAAAKKLGVDGPGTAKVEIHTVAPGQTRPTNVVRSIPLSKDLQPDIPLFVQMGSFSSHVNASNLVRNLLEANESTAAISRLQTDNGLYYRVRVGPLFDIDEANAIVRRLKSKGFQTARIVVQDDTE
jgi:rare lipoprotein A